MPYMADLHNRAKAKPGLIGAGPSGDGPLIPIRGFSGRAKAWLYNKEADTQGGTKTLTVTVHNVEDDDEATGAGNQVGAFTVIVGANDTGVPATFEEIEIDLDNLDPTKPNLQFKAVNANSYVSTATAGGVVLGGHQEIPIPATA